VAGVFIVLVGGSVFALLVAILEFLWKVGRNARKDEVNTKVYLIMTLMISDYQLIYNSG